MAGNWKMNLDQDAGAELVEAICEGISGVDDVDVVVCPPYTSISAVARVIENCSVKIGLGAQNMYYEDSGAFTGEISPVMLKALGTEYVILGHSERRQYFGDTNELVNKKVRTALNHAMIPILCVGETLEQREKGETEKVVVSQVEACLKGVSQTGVVGMVVAYEPIWAIGTGMPATSEDAQDVIGLIRETISSVFGAEAAESTRIQYGGSVKPDNIAELMAKPDIDGGLVGGASLNADNFAKIVRYRQR